MLTLLAVLGGYAATHAYELWSTGPRLRAQRDSARELDQELPAFRNSIAYDTSSFESFAIVLDRPLTAEEAEMLQTASVSEHWDYFQDEGGRLIPYASGKTPDTPLGGTWEEGTGRSGSAVFNMTLKSERSSTLSIIDMKPVITSCEDPTAVTVIDYLQQGTEYYSGVVVDLNHNEPVFYGTDEGPHEGEQFFQSARIDVGGGATPGGLRVEAKVTGQSCEWEIEAEYLDAQQNSGNVTLRDGDRPFFVEVLPGQPEQYWMPAAYAWPGEEGISFAPCHETPEMPMCSLALGIDHEYPEEFPSED